MTNDAERIEAILSRVTSVLGASLERGLGSGFFSIITNL